MGLSCLYLRARVQSQVVLGLVPITPVSAEESSLDKSWPDRSLVLPQNLKAVEGVYEKV